MPGHCHEDAIRVFRIDRYLANLLAVSQSFEVHPRFAGIDGLIDAVAGREIGPLQPLTAGNIDDVWLTLRHCN
jgi:hypothetical protein